MSAVGHHITWTVDGHAEHGVCTADDGKRYAMQTSAGVMAFPYSDGTVQVGAKAVESAVLACGTVGASMLAPKKKQPASGSKRERAQNIYKMMAAANATRKEIIETFVSMLEMTAAGASTYYAQCKAG